MSSHCSFRLLGFLCAALALPAPTLGDPPPKELVQAALQRAQLTEPTVDAWLTKLRLSALLPRLEAGLSETSGTVDNYELGTTAADSWNVNWRRGMRWQVRATVDLTGLLFHRHELGLRRTAVQLANERQQIATKVLDLYFERKRLLEGDPNRQSGPDSSAASQAKRLQYVTELLETLTGVHLD